MDIVQIIEASLRVAVGTTAIVYALAAIGLNVHFGYTGLLNFGQVGFMGVGAYGVAIAAGEIFRVLIQNPGWRDTTGGANGINGFSNPFYDINPIPAGEYGFGP